jgi:hypothetical protein
MHYGQVTQNLDSRLLIAFAGMTRKRHSMPLRVKPQNRLIKDQKLLFGKDQIESLFNIMENMRRAMLISENFPAVPVAAECNRRL